MSIQHKIGQGMKAVGFGFRCVGLVALAIAAVVGFVALDIVILLALCKGGGSRHPFLTGFLFGAFMFNRPTILVANERSLGTSIAILVLISFITSLLACLLSVFLGIPLVGIVIAMIWGSALLLTAIGVGLQELGQSLIDDASHEPRVSATHVRQEQQPEQQQEQQQVIALGVPLYIAPFRQQTNDSNYLYLPSGTLLVAEDDSTDTAPQQKPQITPCSPPAVYQTPLAPPQEGAAAPQIATAPPEDNSVLPITRKTAA